MQISQILQLGFLGTEVTLVVSETEASPFESMTRLDYS